MKIKEIKAMFVKGDKWHAVRKASANCRDEIREIVKVLPSKIVFTVPDRREYDTGFPAITDVIEARPGFLYFKLDSSYPVEVTLTKLSKEDSAAIDWSRNLARQHRDGTLEKASLLNAASKLGCVESLFDERYQRAGDTDLNSERGIFFLITGKRYPDAFGYTWA